MTKPDKRKPDDPKQSKRFIDMAREIGADENPETFERTIDKVLQLKPKTAPQKSDERSS